MSNTKAESSEVAVETAPLPPVSMTDEERYRIMSSDDYSRFLERASLVMERSLADTTDILFDLSGGKETENDE